MGSSSTNSRLSGDCEGRNLSGEKRRREAISMAPILAFSNDGARDRGASKQSDLSVKESTSNSLPLYFDEKPFLFDTAFLAILVMRSSRFVPVVGSELHDLNQGLAMDTSGVSRGEKPRFAVDGHFEKGSKKAFRRVTRQQRFSDQLFDDLELAIPGKKSRSPICFLGKFSKPISWKVLPSFAWAKKEEQEQQVVLSRSHSTKRKGYELFLSLSLTANLELPCLSQTPIHESEQLRLKPNEDWEYLVVAGQDLLVVTQYVVDSFESDGLYVDDRDIDDWTYLRGLPGVTIDFDVRKYDPEDMDVKYVEGSSLGGWALFVGFHSDAVALPAAEFPELNPNSIYFTDSQEDCKIEYYPIGGHDIGIFNYENKTVLPCYYPCDAKNLRKTFPPPMWFFPSRE
ncbi:hypothetical protein STAS_12529 [Striga asiatica]|uniref:KIB1-4 beta-propeller domain-containing protein n=1 Tax=Striga asiatica TaxID=4170 RepID=A0A5A7PTR2_STRAF|nr:hypothetical protein STAS_12529 [Striga asiatica]